MFLVHPTRLSKIFADSRTHPCGNARHRQASKLIGYARAKTRTRKPKNENFLKEPNRKAVFRSGGGPPGVLLPFLTRGSLPLYHVARRVCKPTRQLLLDPQIGDSLRISEPLQTCKPGLQLFWG